MSKSKNRNKKQNRQAHNNNNDYLGYTYEKLSDGEEWLTKTFSDTTNGRNITTTKAFIRGAKVPKQDSVFGFNVKMYKYSEKQPPKENDYYLVIYASGYFEVVQWTKRGWNTHIDGFGKYHDDIKMNDSEIVYWGAIPQRNHIYYDVLGKGADE